MPAHPISTFPQAIKLTGNWRNVRGKTFIAAFGCDSIPNGPRVGSSAHTIFRG